MSTQFLLKSLKTGMLAFLVGLTVWGFVFALSVHQAYGGRMDDPRAFASVLIFLLSMVPLVLAGMLYRNMYNRLLNAAAKIAGLSVWIVLMWVPRSVGLVSLMGSEALYQPSALEIALGPLPLRIIDVGVGFILPFWASALSYRRIFQPAAHRLSSILASGCNFAHQERSANHC